MLKLTSLQPTGLFTFGIHKTIRLHDLGICMLEGINLDRNGGSNGSGKTSTFYAITQILFGKNPSGECGDAIINEVLGKFFGRLEFLSDNGEHWRITDTKKWRKNDRYPDAHFDGYHEDPSEWHNLGFRYSGTDVWLEKWNGTLWADERATNKNIGDSRLDLKATRKKILDIIGISYEQFMSVAYLAQQQSLKFTTGTHKAKLEVLAELSDLGAWDNRVAMVRKEKTNEEANAQRFQSTLDGMRRIGVSLSLPDESLKDVIKLRSATLGAELFKCDLDIYTAQQEKEQWVSNNIQIDNKLQEHVRVLRDLSTTLDTANKSMVRLFTVYSTKCSGIRENPRPWNINQLETDIGELRGKIQIRRMDMENIMGGAGKCPKCFTIVSADHLIRHRELLSVEINEAKAQVDMKTNTLAKIIQDWQEQITKDIEVATVQYNIDKSSLETQQNTINSMIYGTTIAIEELKAQKTQAKENPQHKLDTLAQKRLRLISEQSQCEDRLLALDEQGRRYSEYKSSITELGEKVDKADKKVKILEVVDKLFGDRGIKAYKLQNVLGMLNKLLKECLDVITEGAVSAWVTQYREKTDGDIATDIQIMVREGNKKEVPFVLYSGGERQQIMLAFIGAFWQLASQYGSGVNVLCLDEVFDSLDEHNIELACAFINFMKTLNNNSISSIFVVTHSNDIKKSLDPDTIWKVVKKNSCTTLTKGEYENRTEAVTS